MKRIIFLLAFALVANLVSAQISDDEAKQLYQDAEEQYEAGNYYKCYQMCNDLIVKMGKPNPKILYLDLKAIYNNLEQKNDKSEFTLRKNYKNYAKFSSYADDFFAVVDKNNYPPDKYNEVVEIQKYLNNGMKEYAHEKDRKPEDAINFLNECAKKFPVPSLEGKLKMNTNFSLDSSTLKIEVFSSLIPMIGTNMVARERILIDLSKSWIETIEYQYQGFGDYFFFWEFGESERLKTYQDGGLASPSTDKEAPIVVGPKTYIDGKAKIDNILWFANTHYDKKLEYSEEKYARDLERFGLKKLSSGFYIYELFGQGSDEFRDGNYRKRIRDAFEFLIDFYGGGTPTENKPEVKSKF